MENLYSIVWCSISPVVGGRRWSTQGRAMTLHTDYRNYSGNMLQTRMRAKPQSNRYSQSCWTFTVCPISL